MNTSNLRIGTRGSPLAVHQTEEVASLLRRHGFTCERVVVKTAGDLRRDLPIHQMATVGVFVKALEEALLAGHIDLAVHSAKDMPARLETAFKCVAYGKRKAVHDVLISKEKDLLARLEAGEQVIIGTSALRRQAQFQARYQNTSFVDLRGNIHTRMRQVETGKCDAIVLARAALERLGFLAPDGHELSSLPAQKWHIHILDTEHFTPAIAQGTWAVEVRRDMPAAVQARIAHACNHEATACCVRAERAFLAHIAGGCVVPAFGLACLENDKQDSRLSIVGGLFGEDGQCFRDTSEGLSQDAATIGMELGQKIIEQKRNHQRQV